MITSQIIHSNLLKGDYASARFKYVVNFCILLQRREEIVDFMFFSKISIYPYSFTNIEKSELQMRTQWYSCNGCGNKNNSYLLSIL